MHIQPADLLQNKVGVLLLRLSCPAMGGMVLYGAFSLADTYFVARLGAAALAALTFCLPVQVLIISIAAATGTGLCSLIGRVLGSEEYKHADNIAWHGVAITLAYSVLFLWLGYHYQDELLLLFGCTPETLTLSKGYLSIALPGSLFALVQIVLGNILQGEGETVLPVAASLLGIIFNVALDPVFIFGVGLIPALGLNGAAWAGLLAQLVSLALMIAFVIYKKTYLSWSISHFRARPRIILAIYKVGFPALVMELVGVLIIVFINRTLAFYSYEAVAALGVFLRIRSLVFMPVGGLLQGTMPIASFAFGAGRLERVKEVLVKASALALLIMSLGWLGMQLYPEWIVGFFSRDAHLTAITISALHLGTLFLPLVGPVIILSTVLQAIGKGMAAMWLSLGRQVLFFLPGLIWLPSACGLMGVWLAFALSELLSVGLFLVFWSSLWQELQPGRSTPVLLLIWKGTLVKRLWAWLRWQGLYF
ncbi:MAG: MATE family efflux transporter [Syntrophomonadaceae bacterium]|jgi:putative MATE family efflux protein